jgi:hypothetical protein
VISRLPTRTRSLPDPITDLCSSASGCCTGLELGVRVFDYEPSLASMAGSHAPRVCVCRRVGRHGGQRDPRTLTIAVHGTVDVLLARARLLSL